MEDATLGAALKTSTGKRYKLVYGDDNRALSHLEGHLVTLEARRIGKTLRVSEFHIPAGLHGMNVWFGRLERRGAQLGLQDLNNGAYYLVAEESEADLVPHVGKDVLLEGYVSGTHVVEVLHYQVLE